MRLPILLTILLGAFMPAVAQTPRTPVVFLDISQGLSNNTVRCIAKDHNGFMWFGTRDGLNRYDGNGFTVFRQQFKDSNSLICNFVLCLREDNEHKLWIGTRQGLNTYDNLTGRFAIVSWLSADDHHVHQLTALIKDLQLDDQGNMLIATEGQGLLIKRKGDTVATQIPLATTCHYGVQAIRISNDHHIWVQVQNKGLCLLDGNNLKLVNDQLPLAAAMEYTTSGLWLSNINNLYHYDEKTNTFNLARSFFSGSHGVEEIWTLLKNNNGGLLIGTTEGRVLTWDIAKENLIAGPSGDSTGALHFGTIYGLYIDELGDHWIGTAKGGVGLVDPQRSRFHTYSHLGTSGQASFVTSFVEMPDSDLYLGTEGEGIFRYDRRQETFTHYFNEPGNANSTSGNAVMAMCADYEHKIWTATNYSGVDKFDPVTHRFTRYHCTPPISGVEKNLVWFVYEDRQKDLWVTTLRQGSLMGALYRLDRTTDKLKVFDTTLSDLFALYEDNRGTLWGGNLSQLVAIDRVGRHHRFYDVNYAVRCFLDDNKGRLWVGTEGGGLLLFDRRQQKVVDRFTTDEGLCNNSVLGILQDTTGNLWLSTANGLSRFNPEKRQFRNYFQADGLQSNEFLFDAALKLRTGEMAFGGIKGFNLFDPQAIHETGHMAKLMLTGITVNGVQVEKDPSVVAKWGEDQVAEIKVPYNKAFFSFDFTALEYSTPKEISYAYIMDGWDPQWTQAGRQRKAAYTHLDEGHYTFRVKSADAEGRWNPQEIALQITVLPPWYRTWWAYMLYTAIIGSLLYLYWYYRNRQTKLRYEITIARLNAEKERSEHEKKLAFFTNISHEFRTPLTLIINPVKDLLKRAAAGESAVNATAGSTTAATHERAELNLIHRNARRMLSLVDQLLIFRKADSDADVLIPVKLNFCDLCREVFLSFTHQARIKNIRYEFTCDNESLELYADKEKTEIILFNLVSNALKYTPEGGAVSLSIHEHSRWVDLDVTDTGPGIPKNIGNNIFERFYQAKDAETRTKPGFGIGLYLAKHFAVQHKGDLTYTSEPGKGATFTLRLLKASAHFPDIAVSATPPQPSELFQELIAEDTAGETAVVIEPAAGWVDDKKSLLIVDDDAAMRNYIVSIFRESFTIYEAENGEDAIKIALETSPDLIISDIKMGSITGIDLCRSLKTNPASSHIPIILLTGSTQPELHLEGVEGGADDYLTKPFNKELLQARVANLLQGRTNLRKALFNEITHNEAPKKISADDKAFLEKCTAIVEQNLDEEGFNIKTLAREMGISHSTLYKKIKSLSGHSLNEFIRLIRLRHAAILCINSNYNVNEIAIRVGILDRTHFREQFQKVYGMTAAEYIRKYRKPLSSEFALKRPK